MMTPKQWRNSPTPEDCQAADELEQYIEKAMKTSPPGDASDPQFVYNFPQGRGVPNVRVQQLIVERFEKSNKVPDGWSSVVFESGTTRPFIRFVP